MAQQFTVDRFAVSSIDLRMQPGGGLRLRIVGRASAPDSDMGDRVYEGYDGVSDVDRQGLVDALRKVLRSRIAVILGTDNTTHRIAIDDNVLREVPR